MGISGIGSYGMSSGIFGYQSSLNEFRLQQALDKNTRYKGSSLPSLSSGSSLSGSLSYLKSYNSNMSELMESANALRDSNSSGVMNKISTSSSDTDVASVTSNVAQKEAGSYKLSVEQLASAQQNVSSEVTSNATADSKMNLSIATKSGTVEFNVSDTRANGSKMSNVQQLKDMASKINSQKLGVNATVVTKDGKSSLQLTGTDTGEKNGFKVSGTSASEMGLDNAVTEAQNAKYSVSKNGGVAKQYESSTNKISLESGKMTANLKKTGDVTITNGVDNTKVVSAVKDLIESYNKTFKTLSSNSERGSGSKLQLRNMTSSPTAKKSMELIGISTNKDGTLKLDAEKLTKSLQENPSLTKSIISGPSGLAEGAFKDAQSGLNRTTASLISSDFKSFQMEDSNDSINFMNMYARSGAKNMMNYHASGMLFNMMV